MNDESVMAFDFGRRRIGIAVGQSVTGTARPVTTLKTRDLQPDWPRIDHLIQQWRPDRLVVGLPLHADGRASDFSHEVKTFAAELASRFSLPVALHNEHLTSSEARARLRERRRSGQKKRKVAREEIDAEAAALILQSWLDTSSG